MSERAPLLCGVGLASPARDASQRALGAVASARQSHDAHERRVIDALYRRSKIARRGSVLFDGEGAGEAQGVGEAADAENVASSVAGFARFYPAPGVNGSAAVSERGPGVAERMARFQEEALPLACDAARRALEDAGMDAGDVAELVVVTCTGFQSPGVDLGLIASLGLSRGVGRTQVGFMGCHGAFNGLRVAAGLCEPGRAVLVVCVELCTLHFQYGWRPQQVVANALFADGAAACVVRHPDDLKDARGLVSADTPMGIRGRASHVIPGTEGLMTWTIEDHGFAMTLDPKTPSAVAGVLPDWLDAWLAAQGMSRADVGGWAIHPGGPRLLETVGGALGLSTEDLEASRGVLQNHGNMSSGTVLFILDALREAGTPGPWVAMAFGPGLTIEAALLG